MIVLYLGALLLTGLAVGCIARGVHVWRSPGRDRSLPLEATGLDGAMIYLGVALLFGALLDLGDAISVHGTRANAGGVLFAIAGIGFLPAAFLFRLCGFSTGRSFSYRRICGTAEEHCLVGAVIIVMSAFDRA